MSLDRNKFFANVRVSLFGNKLSQPQVDGMNNIIDEWERNNLQDVRRLAYILATTFHETAFTMQPIEEWGKGKKHKYGIPDAITGKAYYGRGYVQLTWKANYKKMGDLLGVDLVNKPELALDTRVAVRIMFEGMLTGKSYRGDFTGRSLEDFFNPSVEDWVNARKIINGLDKASQIATYGKKFYQAMTNI